MNQFSIDILLEFLYNKFAITFVFCLFGSLIREYFTVKTTYSNNKKGNLNAGKMLISAIFSTFLMCAGADYVNVDLHIEVYAIISVVLGMWGMSIIRCIMNGKFIYNFCINLAKTVANPILKGAVESASKTLEEYKDTDKQQTDKNETEKQDENNKK